MKIKKVVLLMVIIALATVIVLPGCKTATTTTAAAAETTAAETTAVKVEPVTLKMGTTYSLTQPASLGILKAIELASAKSGGAIKIEYFDSGQLGANLELAKQMMTGGTDMNVQSLGYFVEQMPECEVDSLFFMYKNWDHLYKVWSGEIGDYFKENLRTKVNVHLIDPWEYGQRVITTKKTEIRTPEDLAGLRIRVPDIKIHVDMVKAMGADPTPMAMTELYMALSQGVVDGQENPVSVIMANKFDETQGVMSLTNHKVESVYVMINAEKWDSLSAEQQRIITESFIEAREINNNAVNQGEIDGIAAFEAEGKTVVKDVDVKAFRDLVIKFIGEKYPEDLDLFTRVQAVE